MEEQGVSHSFPSSGVVASFLASRQNTSCGEEGEGDQQEQAGATTAITRQQHAVSCWETESNTPCTTRPHYALYHHMTRERPPSPILHRRRSRSLGSSIEHHGLHRNREVYHVDWKTAVNRVKKQQSNGLQMEEKKSDEETTMLLSPNKSSPALLKPRSTLETVTSQERTSSMYSSSPDDDKTAAKGDGNAGICVMYGLINASIVLPVMMSFSSIIYRDQAFAAYMPVLTKLTVISGIVHQLCFVAASSLPFAVGAVQDAGLIFLSSMATYIVTYCRDYADSEEEYAEVLMATATVGLSLATAVLGAGLVLVGKWRLAQYVQLLPTCVIGGYLAYIGWFCGLAGVGLMAGTSEITPAALLQIVTSDTLYQVLPGILSGILLYGAVRNLRHMAVLPCGITLLLMLFYLVLWCCGTTVEEVTDLGWIRKMDDPPPLLHTWDFLQFDKVVWSVMPKLLLTEISMIFVVALSSSLDVAAIELELQQQQQQQARKDRQWQRTESARSFSLVRLNYNHELQTVGWSNIISGLTGGYTGSYIFSQSIFSLRAGVRNRIAGLTLALAELVAVVIPIPILAYVPNFFFGALLTMICVDLLVEWLCWHGQEDNGDEESTKVQTFTEYLLSLVTFFAVQFAGVEYGILIGVGCFLLCRQLGLDVGDTKIENDARVNSSMKSGAGMETLMSSHGNLSMVDETVQNTSHSYGSI